MHFSKANIWLFILIFLCLIAYSGTVAFAQEGLVLTISPLKFELKAKRGQELVKEVTLGNASSSLVSIETSARDFVAEGEKGKPRFVPEEQSPWSMSRWVKAEPARFDLQAGERKKIKVIIRIPKDAEPGGHYAAILFSSAPSRGGQTAVVAKLGSLILLRVAGKIVEKGSIASLVAPRLVERGPIDFKLRFENKGNVHLKPQGKLKIWRLWGRPLVNLNVGGENVLPKSARLFPARWKNVPSLGLFVAQGKLKYGAKGNIASSPRAILFVMP